MRRLIRSRRRARRVSDGEAYYLGTTVGGSRHHRIIGGLLFGRGPCRYWLEPGTLVFQRDGGPVVTMTGISQVGLAGAHAGQVLAPNRIAIVTWIHEENEVDSGFGFTDSVQAEAFADRVAATVELSPDKGPHASA